jgi:predicted Zn-dependent protease
MRFLPAVTLPLAALIAVACATNPATGHRELSLVGERQEIEMGREAAEQVRTSIGLYDDAALEAYVDEIGQRLAARSERPQLAWSFHVVDDAAVNAFALPGGYVYVTRGLLTHANSEAELAAVLGHEIGHVAARHSVSQISKAQLASLGLGIGMILRPDLASLGQLGQAGLGLLMLKYSRDDETEADELGLRYMTRAGYPAPAMADVMAMLERVSESQTGGRVPSWLSTHPSTESRLAHVDRELRDLDAGGDRGYGRAAYLRHLDGVVYGPDPREGFVKDDTFYHPAFGFRVDLPKGFITSNTREAVSAVSERRDAIVVLTTTDRGSPETAAREFFSQPGVAQGREWQPHRRDVDAVGAEFEAMTSGAALHGVAAFATHQGRVFQLVGYTTAALWPRYDDALADAVDSFRPLTDRRYLDVQPMRVHVVTVARTMPVDDFARRQRAAIEPRELALVNGVGDADELRAGQLAKTVVGDGLVSEIAKAQARSEERR